VKRLTLLPLLLTLAACGSSKDQFGLAKTNFISDCQHGGVEIMVGLSGQGTTGEDRSDPMTFNVEVANNSRADITVRSIRIEVRPSEVVAYRLDNTYREFNQTIPENEEHVFELPTTGHGAPMDPRTERRGSSGIEVVASVRLEGGDEYRCRYQVPGPQ
jgi:hypothetical protein